MRAVKSLPGVSLYIRITDQKGRRRYERIRRRSPQMCRPNDVYCLHFYECGKRKWLTVGNDLNSASRARGQKEQELLLLSRDPFSSIVIISIAKKVVFLREMFKEPSCPTGIIRNTEQDRAGSWAHRLEGGRPVLVFLAPRRIDSCDRTLASAQVTSTFAMRFNARSGRTS